jgi:hypothetical protein
MLAGRPGRLVEQSIIRLLRSRDPTGPLYGHKARGYDPFYT